MAEGREGDWECSGCNNRNYAFRSFCNRCKQPRLLVDINTPPNSKWLPRIGDWICTGCTNNNYASREKCKKCGQPKELAALPAIAMPGVFARGQGGLQPSMGIPQMGTSAFEQSLAPHSTWPLGGSVAPQGDTKGWRNGDWICNCGFHNYSSRTQCKKCKAAPPALGIKRLASDEPVHYWDNKRLNAGAGPQVNHYMQSYSGFGPVTGFIGDQELVCVPPIPLEVQRWLQVYKDHCHNYKQQHSLGKGLNNGVTEIGCVQIAITITMHPDLSVIGVRLKSLWLLSQLVLLRRLILEHRLWGLLQTMVEGWSSFLQCPTGRNQIHSFDFSG